MIAGALGTTRLRHRKRVARSPLVSLMDLRLGFRLLVRQPLLAITAIVALTVGIGLANIGFASTEALLFSQLPFEGGDRFVRLVGLTALSREPAVLTAESYPPVLAQVGALEHLGAVTGGRESVTLPSGAIEGHVIAGITPSSFAHLPASPIRGRLLGRDEGEDGRPRVALISETFWRRSLAAADAAIGATLTIAGALHTIVGVMPASFEFPNTPAVWVPLDEGFWCRASATAARERCRVSSPCSSRPA